MYRDAIDYLKQSGLITMPSPVMPGQIAPQQPVQPAKGLAAQPVPPPLTLATPRQSTGGGSPGLTAAGRPAKPRGPAPAGQTKTTQMASKTADAFSGRGAAGNSLGEVNMQGPAAHNMPFRAGQNLPEMNVGEPLAMGQHMNPNRTIIPNQKPPSTPQFVAQENALRLAPEAQLAGIMPQSAGKLPTSEFGAMMGQLAGMQG